MFPIHPAGVYNSPVNPGGTPLYTLYTYVQPGGYGLNRISILAIE